MRVHLLACALTVSALSFASAARADVAGPHDVCDVEGLGCTSCWEPYGGSGGGAGSDYATCAADATSKGLVDACQDGQGAGDNHYFCPKGVTVGKKTVGGGCSIGAVPAGGVTAGVLAALGLAALLRRRSRR